MAKFRVVVKLDLRVERNHLLLRRKTEWVDLHLQNTSTRLSYRHIDADYTNEYCKVISTSTYIESRAAYIPDGQKHITTVLYTHELVLILVLYVLYARTNLKGIDVEKELIDVHDLCGGLLKQLFALVEAELVGYLQGLFLRNTCEAM